jgi:hypothetical protein
MTIPVAGVASFIDCHFNMGMMSKILSKSMTYCKVLLLHIPNFKRRNALYFLGAAHGINFYFFLRNLRINRILVKTSP